MNNVILTVTNHTLQLIYLFFLFFVFFQLGSYIYRLFFSGSAVSEIEKILYSTALGIGTIAYLIFFIGILGILYKSVIIIILALISIIGFWNYRNTRMVFPTFSLKKHYIMPLTVIGLFCTLNFLCSLAPETFYDSLVYHLTIPLQYLQNHKIFHLKYNIFSGLSLTFEMIYAAALALGNEILAKLIHFSMGIGILLVLYEFGKRLNNSLAGVLAGMIFYSIPVVSVNSVNTQIDLAMTFFMLVSLLALFNWHNENSGNKWLFLSAVFSGLAITVKYSAIFSILAVNAVIFWNIVIHRKKTLHEFIMVLVKYNAILFLFLLPWLIKNIVFTSVPFYPYFSSVKNMTVLVAEQKRVFVNSIGEFYLFWKNIIFTTAFGNVRIGFLPLFGFVFFFVLTLKKSLSYFNVFFAVSLLTWFVVTKDPRYLLPGWAILSLITAYGLLLIKDKHKLMGYFLYSLILLTSVYNFFWIARLHNRNMEPLKVVFGLEDKSSYLSKEKPRYLNPPYSAINYINNNLSDSSKVLFVGEPRAFYCEKNFITHTVFDNNPLEELLKSTDSERELLENLRKESITHIFCNINELKRSKSHYPVYNISKKKALLFNDFLRRYCKLIYHTKDNLFLFAIAY